MKGRLLQQLFTAQAESRPDADAIVLRDQKITYGRLEAISNQLARALKNIGCRPSDRVAILMPKSIPAISAILGILKADCVYVPVDISSPPARLRQIAAAIEAACIITHGNTANQLSAFLTTLSPAPVVGWLGSDPAPPELRTAFNANDLAGFSDQPLGCSNHELDLAHILFTSGTTGVPKGVPITHASVRHFVEWSTGYFDYQPSDRISGHSPLSFDLSTMDIHATLAAGACLYPVTPEMSLLPNKLADFIRESKLTQWLSVPSLLDYMSRFGAVRQDDFPALKRLLWCGEAFAVPALIHWMKLLPHVRFTNLYGPTETTIASSFYTMPAPPANPTTPTPIGLACPGERLRVLNEEGACAPAGEMGDLYISGNGLSPGYWRDPVETEQSFVRDPEDTTKLMYRTGDLGSCDADGLFYLHGRRDAQTKSRGYRIELGEIERAFGAIAGIEESAVVATDVGGFEGAAICAAYSVAEGQVLEPGILRRQLADLIPPYMMPAYWFKVPSLPRNAHGKVDLPMLRRHFQTARGAPSKDATGD